MLLALTTPSGSKSALPAVARTLPQAELIHRALVSKVGFGREPCPEIIGRDEAGETLKGHGHCHLLPVDMDGDGLLDIVSGKRFWAHGPKGDAEPNATPVTYFFKLTRDGSNATWKPVLISDTSGVGTQVMARDINGDGKPDVAVGNKLGTFISLQQ